jgi:hypothetical protein
MTPQVNDQRAGAASGLLYSQSRVAGNQERFGVGDTILDAAAAAIALINPPGLRRRRFADHHERAEVFR